jgi:DNA/RNA endonuclease YhcR with UshA esterase domain
MRSKPAIMIWAVAITLLSGIGIYQQYSPANGSIDLAPNSTVGTETASTEEKPVTETNSIVHTNRGGTPIKLMIGSIGQEDIKKRVSIEARIKARREHKNGHIFLTVSDDTGQIKVPVFSGKGIDTAQLQVGRFFSFTGLVQSYKGELQIVPARSQDVRAYRNPNS